jgi:hypothetical protein
VATDQAPPGADTRSNDPLQHNSGRWLSELEQAYVPAPVVGGAVAGLYLPSVHPGHTEHQLTQKIRSSKTSSEHDLEFADLLAAALARQLPGLWPDVLVSIPPRRGQRDRFTRIRAELAGRIGAADGGRALWQTRVVEGYREMTTPQRIAACAGRFAAQTGVCDKSVLLIDDVITSGAQASEAIRALKAAGAEWVGVLALALATAPLERTRPVRPGWQLGGAVSYDHPMSERVIREVIAVEPLPLGESGSRRARVRWSDGSAEEALRWWDDLCGHPHKSSYADPCVMPTWA